MRMPSIPKPTVTPTSKVAYPASEATKPAIPRMASMGESRHSRCSRSGYSDRIAADSGARLAACRGFTVSSTR